jgi:hypothetical protein
MITLFMITDLWIVSNLDGGVLGQQAAFAPKSPSLGGFRGLDR